MAGTASHIQLLFERRVNWPANCCISTEVNQRELLALWRAVNGAQVVDWWTGRMSRRIYCRVKVAARQSMLSMISLHKFFWIFSFYFLGSILCERIANKFQTYDVFIDSFSSNHISHGGLLFAETGTIDRLVVSCFVILGEFNNWKGEVNEKEKKSHITYGVCIMPGNGKMLFSG